VLNSVPFYEDRVNIIRILSALAYNNNANVYGWILSTKCKEWETPEREYLSDRASKTLKFRLNYENGIMLGNYNKYPKVQKYHSIDEAIKLFKNGFENVKVMHTGASISVIAKSPKFDVEALKAAIEFEFNLPYSDGTTMGLVDEAKESFAIRLNKRELR